MKKILTGALLLALASSALAQYGHYRPHHFRHHSDDRWIAPLILGGIVGAVIVRESQKPPVVVQQPPVIINQPLPSNVVIIDGQVYTKQLMQVDGVFREVLVRQ